MSLDVEVLQPLLGPGEGSLSTKKDTFESFNGILNTFSKRDRRRREAELDKIFRTPTLVLFRIPSALFLGPWNFADANGHKHRSFCSCGVWTGIGYVLDFS